MEDRKDYMELVELQTAIKGGLESIFPGKLWVKAEIASLSVKSNGHCYMELAQNDGGVPLAKARAVIWRNRWGILAGAFLMATGKSLCAGMTVLARCTVSYSEIYGLSLNIDDIDAQTSVGEQELQRRRTLERLEKEGLMDRQQELSLAPLPRVLAIISAEGAAGLGDFMNHLHGNPYGFAFVTELFEAQMQGTGAPESIIDAFERIEASGRRFDAVLLLRGGGGQGDLECFDDYGIAFSIATCPVPVFTAIGHDRDRHIADMVSWKAVKTPTALADEFVECLMAEDQRLEGFTQRLRQAFLSHLAVMSSRVDVLEARIKAADPRGILSRGFSLVTDASGVVRKSAAGFSVGETVGVMFADGTLKCKVNGKEKV